MPIRMPASPQIRLFCPECDGRLKTPLSHSGRKFRCPFCKTRITIPAIRDGAKEEQAPVGKSVEPDDLPTDETLITPRALTPTDDLDAPPPEDEETLLSDEAPATAPKPPPAPEKPARPLALDDVPADDSGIRYGIKRVLGSFARETGSKLEETADSIGTACFGASIIGFVFSLAMAYIAMQSFEPMRGCIGLGTFLVSLGLLFLSYSFRRAIGPRDTLLGGFVSLLPLGVAITLIWVLSSLLADLFAYNLPGVLGRQERFILGVVGAIALWGASYLWRRVHVLLFVCHNFGEGSDMAQCTPWEVTQRIHKGLLLAAGSDGVLRMSTAVLSALVAAALVILNAKEYGLYAIGPAALAVMCGLSGFTAMRRRRIVLEVCAEMVAEQRQIRFLELRSVVGSSVRQIKRLLATLRRSGAVPTKLLEPEIKTGKLLEKHFAEPGGERPE
ncbi:MAG: hypothetical protein GXP25_11405 [Planctomycetes bacterium]|nr:hypothetical protein [Planctomycetota bacterium]